MKNVHLVLNWGGEWKSHHGEYWYESRRAKAFAFSRDSNYDQLLDKVYNVTGIDKDYYRIRVFKSDTTRYQARCIVEDCNWRLSGTKVPNSEPVIAIDGTLLKGPHRGVLFVAVCMDDNDQIFPLAFSVGDSMKLYKVMGEVDDLVIVSDRKGSITTGVEKSVSQFLPRCICSTFRTGHGGHYGRNKALKQYFRRAARVYRENQCMQQMEQLEIINSKAAQYVTNT
ncbi:hypothetical protein Ddye_023407, partial [Dipteronia dyeriana]